MFSANILLEHLQSDSESFPQGQHYLMMDPALNQAMLQQYFLLDEAPEYVPLYLGLSDELMAISPYIITLKDSTKDFLDWFQHESSQWGFIFYSNFNLNQQLPYWQSLLEIQTSNGETYFFRFFDGVTAHSFWHYCTTQERDAFYQPCQSLILQLSNGNWERCALNNLKQLCFSPDQPWFVISNATLSTISNLNEQPLRLTIEETLWLAYPDQMERIPPATFENLLNHGLEKARAFGIKSEKHLTLFICFMFECAPNFYSSTAFQACLQDETTKNNVAPGEKALDKMVSHFNHFNWVP